MNSSGGKTPSTSSASSARPSAYNANAMAMIRNELSQYANSGEMTGQQSPQPQQCQQQATNVDRNVIFLQQMLSQVGIDVSQKII
ncbi:hypothetical protein PVAND_001938 [Polypedilum vanderplanki]|uniref:Uncharacterized protein n=1 Tax=Polypedilum vanderplanki TaxID=319348 RepID=A0A9J6BPV6_POLVA|nr:hypothetical protein PVAND_001938 [Polypedilum vanderplanki]